MSYSSKVSSLQSYNMCLYRTALHPEFFDIAGRNCIQHGEYEFDAWIFPGGHAVRYEYGGLCVSEVVSDDISQLPDRGLVTSLPCAGEKEYESEFSDQIIYMTSIQSETLTDHLFLSTYNELLDHAKSNQALLSIWGDQPEKPNLSMIDMQRFADQIHLQSFHLRSDCGLVLRTQSIFQIKKD